MNDRDADEAACVAILEPVESMKLPEITRLSIPQRKIVTLASRGATIAEIARSLGRSPETIRTHLKRVYRSLGISSRAELAVMVQGIWFG